MKDFRSFSPLNILEKSSYKELGPGNLGVLVARAGVGKTACLIRMALDKILRQEKLLHVSLEEGPDKVTYHYDVTCHEIVASLGIDDESDIRSLIERCRMILAYVNQSFDIARLRANLSNLAENMNFKASTIIVDGLDFDKTERALFEDLRRVAGDFGAEVWLSALSHRHIAKVNERGIPHPVDQFDDLFSVVVQLQPEHEGLFLNLLKDHDRLMVTDMRLRLDPATFLPVNRD